jgi:hypothetical protein
MSVLIELYFTTSNAITNKNRSKYGLIDFIVFIQRLKNAGYTHHLTRYDLPDEILAQLNL